MLTSANLLLLQRGRGGVGGVLSRFVCIQRGSWHNLALGGGLPRLAGTRIISIGRRGGGGFLVSILGCRRTRLGSFRLVLRFVLGQRSRIRGHGGVIRRRGVQGSHRGHNHFFSDAVGGFVGGIVLLRHFDPMGRIGVEMRTGFLNRPNGSHLDRAGAVDDSRLVLLSGLIRRRDVTHLVTLLFQFESGPSTAREAWDLM